MRAFCFAFFALALPAQVQAPMPQPQWLTDLQKLQQEMHQAGLGSLDAKVEQAWRAALQTPRHPQFHMAAQMASSFYQSQGYDLKAEQVLREALAAVPADDAQTRRNLTSQLANYFESIQQLTRALPIREALAKEPPPPSPNGYPPASQEAAALANLYERMGDLEKAEAAWKEVAARRATEGPGGPGTRVIASRKFVATFGPGYGGEAPNDLASFYARHGRAAEAEQLYMKALADAANGAADDYIGFLSGQRRFDEAIELLRQSIARMEASSDPNSARMLLYKRQHLANLLAQAGRSGEALAMRKQTVELAQAGPEYAQALAALADTLISQNNLEEAEKAAARMREAGAADTHNARFHESMAVQIMARIRDMQKRPEEARQLRESVGVPDLAARNRETTVYDIVGPAQQAAMQGDKDRVVAAANKAIAVAAERSRTNPQEVAGLMSLVSVLMSQQKEEARRVAVETLRILEQAPNHPRVADAIGSIAAPMAQLGMLAEAERLIERQETILIGAKGAESLALNSVSQGRIDLMMQREVNWAGIVEERKRMLARTERVAGAKSSESLYALREVAWAYPPLNNWPEEEQLLAALLERTVGVSGKSSLDHAHLLVHMANRASQNRQFDKAVNWIDQAIEVARTLPDGAMQLEGMMQNRAHIVQAKDAPAGGPFYAPQRVPANGGRWFDTDRFQRTDGTRLGNVPAGGVVISQPTAMPARGTPVAEPKR